VKLLIEPDDGIAQIIKGIEKAKKSVEILIFRFDLPEVERALVRAVERGVAVSALIAFTNRGGEKNLRKLEMRFLAHGITVARTADDLVRYHGKLMLIDRKELYLLAFNFTRLDFHSRSFGVVTRNPQLAQEAGRLLDADTQRKPYSPQSSKFIVSPVNARKELAAFIKGAKKELLIYDIKISDHAMIRLLEDRVKAGVEVRVIGEVTGRGKVLSVHNLKGMRLHARAIIRDRHQAFLGSQSLRELELDERREIGVIFRDAKAVNSMIKVFQQDWSRSKSAAKSESKDKRKRPRDKAVKKVARAVAQNLPVGPVVAKAVKQVIRQEPGFELEHEEMAQTVQVAVKEAVKDAVKKAVRSVVEEAVAQGK
jgi:cardiolipin synthase